MPHLTEVVSCRQVVDLKTDLPSPWVYKQTEKPRALVASKLAKCSPKLVPNLVVKVIFWEMHFR